MSAAPEKQYVVIAGYRDSGFYSTTIYGVFAEWALAEEARKKLAEGKDTKFLSMVRLVTPGRTVTGGSTTPPTTHSAPEQPLRQATTLRDR